MNSAAYRFLTLIAVLSLVEHWHVARTNGSHRRHRGQRD